MSTSIRRASFAVIAAGLVATPALATPIDSAFEARANCVELADLDLRRDDDVRRLQTRIRAAATNVSGRGDVSKNAKIRRCQQDALASANRHADAIVVAVRAGKDQRLAVRERQRIIAR